MLFPDIFAEFSSFNFFVILKEINGRYNEKHAIRKAVEIDLQQIFDCTVKSMQKFNEFTFKKFYQLYL